jgi:hypothetical protein
MGPKLSMQQQHMLQPATYTYQADQRFLVQRFKRFTIHPELESAPAPLVKIVSRANARRNPESGVSNYLPPELTAWIVSYTLHYA